MPNTREEAVAAFRATIETVADAVQGLGGDATLPAMAVTATPRETLGERPHRTGWTVRVRLADEPRDTVVDILAWANLALGARTRVVVSHPAEALVSLPGDAAKVRRRETLVKLPSPADRRERAAARFGTGAADRPALYELLRIGP